MNISNQTNHSINESILDEGVGYSKTLPSQLTKKKQQIVIRFSDAKRETYEDTEYYDFLCLECWLDTKQGLIKGKRFLRVPIKSFNRAINVAGEVHNIKNNFYTPITIFFQRISKEKYKVNEVRT